MTASERIKFGRALLADLLELRHCTIGYLAVANDMSPVAVLELINEALATDELSSNE